MEPLTAIALLFVATSSSSACPDLFGDPETRAENRRERRALLELVDVSPHAITIVHSGHWRAPEPIEFAGIELVTSKRRRRAIVELGEELAAFGCPLGQYALRVDDTIGGSARVVSILDELVLVEHEGELRYLDLPGATTPYFSMVWASDFSMTPYLHRKPSALSPPPKTSSARRR
jgi:hypothetical protein